MSAPEPPSFLTKVGQRKVVSTQLSLELSVPTTIVTKGILGFGG